MKPRTLSWLLASTVTAALFLAAGALVLRHPSSSSAVADPTEARPGPGLYYCPMHPSYRSDKPGNCPICNMKLVPVEADADRIDSGSVAGRAPAVIPVDLQKRIGLRTSPIERRAFARTIRATGRVDYDERTLSAVSLRYGGWIEELFVRSTGDAVRPGDPLLSIYSPELYEAQRSYLAARKSLAEGDEAVKSARQRLLLWDMTEDQIRELEGQGESGPRTAVLSKVGGTVTRREARLGMRVEPGATLFEVADLSTVWVQADVYEEEIPLVRVGSAASIELASDPGEPLSGRIAFVYPALSEATRTARVRIEVANPDGKLKPGAYATVSIAVDLGLQLVIDVDAVLDTGTRRLVFVETGEGRFEPREVTLGARSQGRAVVLSGLEAGEKIVASGTFLVDSESRLRAALREHAQQPGGHAGHAGH